jgi:hypothetical protein
MKKSFTMRSVIYSTLIALFCVWNSALAGNEFGNNQSATDTGKVVKQFEGAGLTKVKELSVAQNSTQSSSGNYDVTKSTNSSTSGNYDVNTSTTSSRSGNYDVNKSTSTSQGTNQNKTDTDKTQDREKAISDRVKSSPRYSVPLINGRGSYAQGK